MGNQQGYTNPCSTFTKGEIKKILKAFEKIDEDKSGELEIDEFLRIPELSQNPLVRRVVSIFDKDKNGSISLEEFITGLSSLYSDDEEIKIKFVFKVYDIDDDGYITNGELFQVLKMMVGNNLSQVQLQQLVDRTIIKADKDYDGKISFIEFKNMVKDLNVGSKIQIDKI